MPNPSSPLGKHFALNSVAPRESTCSDVGEIGDRASSSFQIWKARQEELLHRLFSQHEYITFLFEGGKEPGTLRPPKEATQSPVDIDIFGQTSGVARPQLTPPKLDSDSGCDAGHAADDIDDCGNVQASENTQPLSDSESDDGACERSVAVGAVDTMSAKRRLSNSSVLKEEGDIGDETAGEWLNDISHDPLEGELWKPSVGLEGVVAVLIALNTICIAWQVQYQADYGQEPEWAALAGLIFCIIFTTEVSFRIVRDGRFFLHHSTRLWNLFDVFVVACMLFEQGVRDGGGLSSLRVIRLARVARILRAARLVPLMRMSRTGRLFTQCFGKSIAGVCVLLTIFGVMAFVIALILSQGTLDVCAGNRNSELLLCQHFGSLWKSWFAIVQTMLGGRLWGPLVDALSDLDFAYAAIFIFFSAFVSISALNIITAIYVNQVDTEANVLKDELYFHDELVEKANLIARMKCIFFKLDMNESGAMSKDELEHAFEDSSMIALLSSMQLDHNGAESLFELLDFDGSGQVNITEFVVGCMKLRGQARAVEVAKVHSDVGKIGQAVDSIRRHILNLEEAVAAPPDAVKGTYLTAIVEPVEKKPRKSKAKNPTVAGDAQTGKNKAEANVFVLGDDVGRMRSMLLDKPVSQKRCVDDAVKRALHLHELQNIWASVKSLCVEERWHDVRSGKPLEPEQVNLYNFDFYAISPLTANESITLKGLKEGHYCPEQLLIQRNSHGNVVAEGVVLEDVQGENVQIRLLKGKFQTKTCEVSHHPDHHQVYLGDHRCGIPDVVVNVESVSYKELLSSTPTEPTWYCCHWWGEPIIDFLACCKAHATQRHLADNEAGYWVCGYANRQHDLEEDMGTTIEMSSFARTMDVAVGMLLVLDSCGVPFTRIWCDFELFRMFSNSKKFVDIITFDNKRGKARLLTDAPIHGETLADKISREEKFPVAVLSHGVQLRLEDGEATVSKDKETILESIGRSPDSGNFCATVLQHNLTVINSRVRARLALAAWPQALKQRIVHKFPSMSNGHQASVNLAEIVAKDVERTDLTLSFGGLDVQDSDVSLICQSLPKKLKTLTLIFESCASITDRGVGCVSQTLDNPAVVQSLKSLHLDFLGCHAVTDAGVKFLASKLSGTSLEEIYLSFALCPNITSEGVKSLSKGIPSSAHIVHANFKGTADDRDFLSAKELKATTQHGLLAMARRQTANNRKTSKMF